MVADVDVVNSALRLIGGGRIPNLTDDAPPAPAANDVYSNLLDDLLRQHLWNFATKREKLGQLSTAPTFGFDHAYAVPSDWIRTVSAHPSDGLYDRMVYKEELVAGVRAIVTSADEVFLRYVSRVTDPNLWSADFRRAMVSALARDLAVPVANSNTLHQEYTKQHRRDINRAKSSDAMGSSPEVRPRGSWVANRGRRLPRVGTVDGV